MSAPNPSVEPFAHAVPTAHYPSFDRSAHERTQPGLLAQLATDPATRVLVVHAGRVPLTVAGDALRLAPFSILADAHTDMPGAEPSAFLGRDATGAAILLVAIGDIESSAPLIRRIDEWMPGEWQHLRAFGAAAPAPVIELAASALALSRWHADAPFCPACGAQTELRSSGWARHCPACGREHFPRTDPAVIVAVTDVAGERLLLGSNAAWPMGRYSCFAGFVDAGESAESALERELGEEAGVRVRSWRYVGSQAWPYPRSLMLGYLAVASDEQAPRADGEEIVDVRWFDRAEIDLALRGELDGVVLPGPASIARRLIETWAAEAPAQTVSDSQPAQTARAGDSA